MADKIEISQNETNTLLKGGFKGVIDQLKDNQEGQARIQNTISVQNQNLRTKKSDDGSNESDTKRDSILQRIAKSVTSTDKKTTKDDKEGKFRSKLREIREEPFEHMMKSSRFIVKGMGKLFDKTGLTKGLSFLKTGAKSVLMGSLLLAFIAFINSPFFEKFLHFIADTIIPAIGDMLDWLGINEKTIKKGLSMLWEGMKNIGLFIGNTARLITGDMNFEEYFNCHWGAFLISVGLLLAFFGTKLVAPITLALAMGGILWKLGKAVTNFFSPKGPLDKAANQMNDLSKKPRSHLERITGGTKPLTQKQLTRLQAQNPDLDIKMTKGGSLDITKGGKAVGAERIGKIGEKFQKSRFQRTLGKGSGMGKWLRKFGMVGATAFGVWELWNILNSEATPSDKATAIGGLIGGLGAGALGSLIGGLAGFIPGLAGGPAALITGFAGAMTGGVLGYNVGHEIATALMSTLFKGGNFMDHLPEEGLLKTFSKSDKGNAFMTSGGQAAARSNAIVTATGNMGATSSKGNTTKMSDFSTDMQAAIRKRAGQLSGGLGMRRGEGGENSVFEQKVMMILEQLADLQAANLTAERQGKTAAKILNIDQSSVQNLMSGNIKTLDSTLAHYGGY